MIGPLMARAMRKAQHRRQKVDLIRVDAEAAQGIDLQEPKADVPRILAQGVPAPALHMGVCRPILFHFGPMTERYLSFLIELLSAAQQVLLTA